MKLSKNFVKDYVDIDVDINTLEGVMNANYGDYIIKGVNGEIYPCKPDIFEKTYGPVDTRISNNKSNN